MDFQTPQFRRSRRALLGGIVASPFFTAPSKTYASTPARVYGANPVVSYLLAALAPEQFLGWNFPPPPQSRGYFSDTVLAKPVVGGFFGQGRTPNVELLLENRPDLALVSGATSVSTSVSETQLKKLGVPVKRLILDKVSDYPSAIETLGQWLDISERVQPAADISRMLLAKFNTLPMPKPAPVIYYAEQNDGLATECPGSLHSEVQDLLQATNPVSCPSGEHSGFGMVRISMESLLRMNPEWVLTQENQAFEALQRDPRYADLMAVKLGQVILAPQIPFRWIDRPPSFMRLLAAFWLYDRLYPAHHRFDLEVLCKQFIKAFFNVEMTQIQLELMLNPARQMQGATT